MQRIRSVGDPSSYKSLIKQFKSMGFEITHITADKPPHDFEECNNLHITDLKSEEKQWQLLAESSFLIGTQVQSLWAVFT